MSVHGQLVDGDHTAQTATIDEIWLKPHFGVEVKQTAIYDNHGAVVYGRRDVKNFLHKHPHLKARILQVMKMASIPEFRHSKQVEHLRHVLHAERDEGYFQTFLTAHFKSIIRDVREFYNKTFPNYDTATIDLLPIELQLPVPVMMDDDGWAVFRDAAISAGALEVELREEPICVAATYIPRLEQSGRIKKGQSALIIDIGGMTCDLATAALLEAPSAGDSALRMKRVGQCHGNGAGSNSLNEMIMQASLRRPDCQERLKRLQIDEQELLQQVSDWCDDAVKGKIDDPGVDEFLFTAASSHGQTGVEGLDHHWVVPFSRTEILGFYTNWIGKVMALLREHLKTKIDVVYAGAILVGGGSKSAMLHEAIAIFLRTYNIDILKGVTCEFPCSRGGLTLHFFDKDTLPESCFWYISRSEVYCPLEHPDASLHESLRFRSDYDGNIVIVEDRLTEIKRYSASGGFLPRKKRRILLEVCVKMSPEREDGLHLYLYWSQTHRNEHSPVYDPHGARVPGLVSCPVEFPLPTAAAKLGEMGFKTQEPFGQDPYYLLHVFVDMEGSTSRIIMNATFMKPSFIRKSPGLQFKHNQEWITSSKVVWTPTASHFPSQYTRAVNDQSRFDPHDEPPTGEPASEQTAAIDPSALLSGSQGHTDSVSRQTLSSRHGGSSNASSVFITTPAIDALSHSSGSIDPTGATSRQTRGGHESHATRTIPATTNAPSCASQSLGPTDAPFRDHHGSSGGTLRGANTATITRQPQKRVRRTLEGDLADIRNRNALQQSVADRALHHRGPTGVTTLEPQEPSLPPKLGKKHARTCDALQPLEQSRRPARHSARSKAFIRSPSPSFSLNSPGSLLSYPPRAPSLVRSVRSSTMRRSLDRAPKRESAIAFPDSEMLLQEFDRSSSHIQ